MSRRSRHFVELDEEGNIIVSEWVRYLNEGLYACNICGDVMQQTSVEKATWTANVDLFVTLHEHRE